MTGPEVTQEERIRVGCGPLTLLGIAGLVVALVVGWPWWVKVIAVVVALLGVKVGRQSVRDVVVRPGVASSVGGDGADRARRLFEVARVLQAQVVASGKERPGNRAAVVEAVEAGREALRLTPAGDPERLDRLHTHQLNLMLHKVQGIVPVVDDEAVQVGREAVALSQAGDPRRPDELSNLGIFLFGRAGRDVGAVEECVQLFRDAVVAAKQARRETGAYQARLILGLGALAEVRGDVAPLDEAVGITRTDTFLRGSRRQRGYSLAALSLVLFQSAVRRNDGFVEAVGVTREALAIVPRRDRAARVDLVRNLSAGLTMLDGGRGPLNEAVKVSRREFFAQLRSKRHRHACLNAWGKALYVRHVRLGSARDLRKARRRIWIALLIKPVDRQDRVEDFSVMAAIQRTRYEETGSETDLVLAHQSAVRAAGLARGSGGFRAHAVMAAELAVLAGRAEQAVELVEQAVKELGTSRRAGWMDRHHQYAGLGGLAATAAVAAVAAGRPERAVELLEQTRGLLLADSFDIRGESDELVAAAPDLVAEFDRLRAEIDAVDHAEGSAGARGFEVSLVAGGYEELARRRAALAGQWQELLTTIRARAGLEGFLAPPAFAELNREAATGAIVYVVPSALGGKALIVRDDVTVVDLPAFTEQAATAMAGQLDAAAQGGAQDEISAILGRLWDEVAEPVLRQLGPTDDWPRLWWCPVGAATRIPLHSAGRHIGGDSVMDRVISSYTPTIRALRHARRTADPQRTKVVVVAVPDAPDSKHLGAVLDEAAEIVRLVPEAEVVPGATYDAVRAALPAHSIAHFACHGVADLREPARSRLLLRDRPLTLPAIAALRLDHGEFAYLSACSTTGTPANHADEAAHLAAAFQLAGYRAVIGTLWPIADQAATSMAGEFYRNLIRDGAVPALDDGVATALHHAVRGERDRHPGQPTRWAAHLHLGR
ncbi:CHAT domain-containing protein [Kribbella sp. NPDC051770]|uniref:CHAT domain-containing protein n=1 Tax=Kribbella sp. NPDC051770 TaxID=3155413 RepID=UPI00341977F2